MHRNRDSLILRDRSHLFVETFRDPAKWCDQSTTGGQEMLYLPAWRSRAKPYSDPIVGFAVPLLVHGDRAEQAGFAVLYKSWMHRPLWVTCVRANVHDYFAETTTDAALLDCFTESIEAISVGKHAFEEASRARLEHFGDAEASSGVAIFWSEVPLQWPDSLAEPGDKFEIVGGPS